MATVGAIGLGRMGYRMSVRLLEAGHEVVGYDLREERVAKLRERGGVAGPSPADVARRADLVLTSLPTPAAVEDVCCGEDGLFEADTDGLPVLETTTSTPETTTALASVGAEEGVRLIDAPVSGGTESARDGTLTFMVGAAEPNLPGVVHTVLDALGERIYYLEEVGAGHTAKLVNNVLSAGNRVLAMEAMAFGAAYGIDLEALYELVSNASGSSNQFEKRVPRALNRNFEPGFSVDLSKKDVRLALETAADRDVSMPLTERVHEAYADASAMGYGDEDACAVVKVIEERANTTVASSSEVDETFDGY